MLRDTSRVCMHAHGHACMHMQGVGQKEGGAPPPPPPPPPPPLLKACEAQGTMHAGTLGCAGPSGERALTRSDLRFILPWKPPMGI